jgi:RNA 2',3'-cyclic 3'-phosphodiesterase
VRLFVAIPLPPAALARLASVSERLGGRQLKVVRPEGLHLTLVFLGERDEAEARAIGELLDSPELAVPRIPASLGGYGQFPSRGEPRVIYTPVREGAREIAALQQALVGVLRRGGVRLEEEAREFTPHLTLARRGNGRPDLRGLQDLLAFEERFTADRLVLFQSALKPTGAEYRALRSVELT